MSHVNSSNDYPYSKTSKHENKPNFPNICLVISLPFYLQGREGKKYEKHTTLSLLINFSLQWEQNVLCTKIQGQWPITKGTKFCKFTLRASCLANHSLSLGTSEASQTPVSPPVLNSALASPLKENLNLPHVVKWNRFMLCQLCLHFCLQNMGYLRGLKYIVSKMENQLHHFKTRRTKPNVAFWSMGSKD